MDDPMDDPPDHHLFANRLPNKPLTLSQKIAISRMRSSGLTVKQICSIASVNEWTVYRAIRESNSNSNPFLPPVIKPQHLGGESGGASSSSSSSNNGDDGDISNSSYIPPSFPVVRDDDAEAFVGRVRGTALTEDQKNAIRRMREYGVSARMIGIVASVNECTVTRLLKLSSTHPSSSSSTSATSSSSFSAPPHSPIQRERERGGDQGSGRDSLFQHSHPYQHLFSHRVRGRRLDQAQKTAIYAMKCAGLTFKQIADLVNVEEHTVGRAFKESIITNRSSSSAQTTEGGDDEGEGEGEREREREECGNDRGNGYGSGNRGPSSAIRRPQRIFIDRIASRSARSPRSPRSPRTPRKITAGYSAILKTHKHNRRLREQLRGQAAASTASTPAASSSSQTYTTQQQQQQQHPHSSSSFYPYSPRQHQRISASTRTKQNNLQIGFKARSNIYDIMCSPKLPPFSHIIRLIHRKENNV